MESSIPVSHWHECAKLMFDLLYRCTADAQRNVAKTALSMYVEIWNNKHDDALKHIPERLLTSDTEPELPEFPEDLDPADVDFTDGLIEYYTGAFYSTSHVLHTIHFATAIRSAVYAKQINTWICNYPDEYAQWKAGNVIEGPTFLDDRAASYEAEMAWKHILTTLQLASLTPETLELSEQIAQAYKTWETTLC